MMMMIIIIIITVNSDDNKKRFRCDCPIISIYFTLIHNHDGMFRIMFIYVFHLEDHHCFITVDMKLEC